MLPLDGVRLTVHGIRQNAVKQYFNFVQTQLTEQPLPLNYSEAIISKFNYSSGNLPNNSSKSTPFARSFLSCQK